MNMANDIFNTVNITGRGRYMHNLNGRVEQCRRGSASPLLIRRVHLPLVLTL